MNWFLWVISTMLTITFIIFAMLYGWGLHPVRWWAVILCYALANAMIPFVARLNYMIIEKWKTK